MLARVHGVLALTWHHAYGVCFVVGCEQLWAQTQIWSVRGSVGEWVVGDTVVHLRALDGGVGASLLCHSRHAAELCFNKLRSVHGMPPACWSVPSIPCACSPYMQLAMTWQQTGLGILQPQQMALRVSLFPWGCGQCASHQA